MPASSVQTGYRSSRRRRPAASPHDTGPAILERAVMAQDGTLLRPARTERSERMDPHSPTTKLRAGRRVDGLKLMYERGDLTRPQWQTVERFRDDVDLADCARLSSSETDFIFRPASIGMLGPNDAQLDAVTRVRGALLAAGLQAAPLINFTLIEGGTLADYCKRQRTGHRKVADQLRVALDKMDEYYQNVKGGIDT